MSYGLLENHRRPSISLALDSTLGSTLRLGTWGALSRPSIPTLSFLEKIQKFHRYSYGILESTGHNVTLHRTRP